MQTENLNANENVAPVVNDSKIITGTSKKGENLLKKIAAKKIAKVKKEVVKKGANVSASLVTLNLKQGEKLQSAGLSTINLSQFAKQLSTMEVKVKGKKDTLYIYPDGMSEADKNSDKGKKFRNGLRNQIMRFSNNIFVYAKTNNIDSLKKEITLFKAFYKANYRINDFSAESISQSKNDAKFASIKLMMQIINEVKIETVAPVKKAKTVKK